MPRLRRQGPEDSTLQWVFVLFRDAALLFIFSEDSPWCLSAKPQPRQSLGILGDCEELIVWFIIFKVFIQLFDYLPITHLVQRAERCELPGITPPVLAFQRQLRHPECPFTSFITPPNTLARMWSRSLSNDLLSADRRAHSNQTHISASGIGRDVVEMPQHGSLSTRCQYFLML